MLDGAYRVLRVGKNASPDEVRAAYVRLVRRYPPEHFPEKFAALRGAYQQLTLSDDFVTEALHRYCHSEGVLQMAGCLWGDREELRYDEDFVPDEMIALLKGEDARRELYSLLTTGEEIEWST